MQTAMLAEMQTATQTKMQTKMQAATLQIEMQAITTKVKREPQGSFFMFLTVSFLPLNIKNID